MEKPTLRQESLPRGYRVQRRHGGERELHCQEDRDHHDEHHGGAVGVPLPPVPGLLIARLDPEYRESPERKSSLIRFSRKF